MIKTNTALSLSLYKLTSMHIHLAFQCHDAKPDHVLLYVQLYALHHGSVSIIIKTVLVIIKAVSIIVKVVSIILKAVSIIVKAVLIIVKTVSIIESCIN